MSPSLIAEKSEKARGELRIRVLPKNLPDFPSINVEMDAKTCGSKRKLENIQKTPEGFLKNVVVWLEPPAGVQISQKFLSSEEDAEILLKNCEFTPRVILAAPNQTIHFASEDPILFQIRAKGQKNPRQIRAFPPNLQSVQFRFRQPEIIPISCDLHPWMKAFAVVVPHALYGVTREGGAVKFSRLAPGDYAVNLWHEVLGLKQLRERVSVNSKIVELNVEWDYSEYDGNSANSK
jgi:hypothetical protein